MISARVKIDLRLVNEKLLSFRTPEARPSLKTSLVCDGGQVAKGFPSEAHHTDRKRGTRQCLALEHRGCANWTSGSVASVQINREAAQESSGAVRGIGGASHPPRRTHRHLSHTYKHKCRKHTIMRLGDNHHVIPDRTLKLQGRGAIRERAQLSRSPGTTCLWPHRRAGPE